MSVRPSDFPHETSRLPLGRFSRKLVLSIFFKDLSKNWSFIKNRTRITGVLHEDLRTFMISRSVLVRTRNVVPQRMRPLGTPRRRWEDNIKMDFQEVGWGGMDWIDVAQDRDRWRLLWMRKLTFGFQKMRGISWLAENRLASVELCGMESVSMRHVSDKICRGNQNTHFMFNFFFRKSCRLWVNVETELEWSQMTIQCMRIACWIPRTAHTHTHRICNIYFFSTATSVTRTPLSVPSYVHCLACYMLIEAKRSEQTPREVSWICVGLMHVGVIFMTLV